MTSIKPFRELWLQYSQEMLNQNQNMETILSYLRESGCPIGYSIVIWKKINNISFDEAKQQVYYSKTWQDMKNSNDKLHEQAFEYLETFKNEEE